MKKLILSFVFFLFSTGTYFSQFVVEDIAANASLVMQIEETAKQTIELKSQVETMEKTEKILRNAQESLEQINSVVSQYMGVKKFFEIQAETIILSNKINQSLQSPDLKISPESAIFISNSTSKYLDVMRETVSLMRTVLTPKKMKMTDAERINMIEAQVAKASDIYFQMRLLYLRGY